MKKKNIKNKPRIIITPGDPQGIGPEITFKALKRLGSLRSKFSFFCIGDETALKKCRPYASIIPAPAESVRFLPGFQSGWSIEVAAKLCLQGEADALVTGPISKERLNQGGYAFSGHTDFLAALTGSKSVTMMLLNPKLKVALVTTHVAYRKVPESLTQEAIQETILQVDRHLKSYFHIKKPRIAVLGLNPHNGENGLFGREELEVIEPSVRQTGAFGPFPADTFFAMNLDGPKNKKFDAVIGMYHDQVLTPVKMIDFSKTVNLTLGLPIVRTSVDHGTAFDIAGKNRANPGSMIAAIELAAEIAIRRKKAK